MSAKKSSNPKDLAAVDRLDLTLFPDSAVAYGALAMTEGALKYGAYNFRIDGVSVSTYVAAARRHLAAFYNGEWADPTTGVPHLASALASIAIMIDGFVTATIVDDRPPQAEVADLQRAAITRVQHLRGLFPDSPPRKTSEDGQRLWIDNLQGGL